MENGLSSAGFDC